MTGRYDAVVVGLGAMGSATLYHLAKRGHRVIGIDRHAPPHDQGSSHGATRIIREAYYEHPLYVPLVRRAYELWDRLAADAGERDLLQRNGGLFIGSRESALVRGALRSALEHHVPHELLGAAEVRERFPAFEMPGRWVALHEPGAGLLRPEAAIGAHLRLAASCGARVVNDSRVRRWRAHDDGVRVETAGGSFEARHAVFAAGAWTRELLAEVAPLLRVERQTSHWFAPRDGADLGPHAMPIAMWELDDGRLFYTTPDIGLGVKASFHHGGETADVETIDRAVGADETEEVRGVLERLVPTAAGTGRGSTVCLYTDTPDEHFLVDRHPSHAAVIVVSACSGHGFKFSPAIGEIAADLVEGQRPRVDIAPFALRRFAA